jgi:hypothetical protein
VFCFVVDDLTVLSSVLGVSFDAILLFDHFFFWYDVVGFFSANGDISKEKISSFIQVQ